MKRRLIQADAELRAERREMLRFWLAGIFTVAAFYGAAFAYFLGCAAPLPERQAGAEPALMLELAAEPEAPAAEKAAARPEPAAAQAEPESKEQPKEEQRQETAAEAAKPAPPVKTEPKPKQSAKKEPRKQAAQSAAAAPQIAVKNGKRFAAAKNSAEQGFNGKAEQVWADKAYRKILMQARRWQRQLPAARGTAYIGFRYDAEGQIMAASVKKSSGDAQLDALALKIVEKSSPLPPPPLAGQKTIPVRIN